MPALATLLAIAGLIALSLALLGLLWLISRWMGKVAVSGVNHRAGGVATEQAEHRRKTRTLAQGTALTHSKVAP